MKPDRKGLTPGGTADDDLRGERLAPYVPRLVVDWLSDLEAPTHRTVSGTCVFADVSGFTALTERLAANGKAGAEEMGDLLNSIFDPLLTAAYDYGANLVKWGGDAVLLLFDGEGHALRAARAAWEMQSTMRRIGKLTTSRGVVRLAMSIGVHTGDFDFILTGERYRELVVTGPEASMTSRMERIAQAGQVVLSAATAAVLPPRVHGALPTDEGTGARLLTSAPDVERRPNRSPKRPGVDLGQAFCAPLRDHLVSGAVDYEHRHITVGFVQFLGADALRREAGAQGLAEAVRYVIDIAQQAATDNSVTILSTDVCEDGGKIILVAGAPSSAGDDETRMLGAIRRIVRPGGRLALRAGVTRGRVFAGDYGMTYRRVYSITGDAVNLAARVMAHAGPGQILATPDVLELSRTRFVASKVEPFMVKGKAHPVEAMLVGDLMPDTVVAVSRRMPLIGRDQELALLREAASRAAAGQGQVIDLVGPAGIGKSRLIEELAKQTQMRVLWTDGDVYGSTSAYQPITRLIRRTLGVREGTSTAGLAKTIAELAAGTAPELLPWLSLIGIVAGVSLPESAEVSILDPQTRKSQLEQATSALFGRLLTMPTLIVVNDVHFMDDATIDLVKRFCADVADRPWLIVLSRRPDVESPVSGNMTSIELEPLTAKAARAYLVEATKDTPLSDHRLAQLTQRAGGNPLFLRELSAGVGSGDNLDDLPASIEGVIAARIDQLEPHARKWLRSVSVLGMVIDTELLPGLLGDDDAIIDVRSVREFVARGIDGRLRFAHHLVQQTAYEGLPYRRRTALHARAAQEIERTAGSRVHDLAPILSLHAARGGLHESAWHYARLAGQIARSNYALAEAAECYERAMAASAQVERLTDDEIAEVCEALAETYLDLGELARSERVLAEARRRRRGDPVRLAKAMLQTSNHRETGGRYREALSWLTRGRTILVGHDDTLAARLRAEMSERYSSIRYRQGHHQSAMDWADLAIEEARSAGDVAVEARAWEVHTLAAATAGLPWDRTNFDNSIALYEKAGDVRGQARAYNRLGVAAYYAGRWIDAVEFFTKAEQAYRRVGREFDAVLNVANQAEVQVEQGRWSEALPLLRDAMRVWEAAGSTSFVAFGHYLFGRIACTRGDGTLAFAEFTTARSMSVELGEVESVTTIDSARAECMIRNAHDHAGALELAEATIETARREATELPALSSLQRIRGVALVGLGRTAEGVAALHEALATARARRAQHDIASALGDLVRLDLNASAQDRATWSDELEQLTETLGLVSAPERHEGVA